MGFRPLQGPTLIRRIRNSGSRKPLARPHWQGPRWMIAPQSLAAIGTPILAATPYARGATASTGPQYSGCLAGLSIGARFSHWFDGEKLHSWQQWSPSLLGEEAVTGSPPFPLARWLLQFQIAVKLLLFCSWTAKLTDQSPVRPFRTGNTRYSLRKCLWILLFE
jgi:hypothetical protein